MTRIGVSHRPELALWLDSRPPEITCLEIVAEHFADPKRFWRLRRLTETYPLMLHSLGLSLGTPGPLDRNLLARFVDIVAVAEPLWVSEHIGFCRTAEVDLGHFNPVPPTRDSIRIIADHARAIVEACGRPLILENITTNMLIPGDLSDTEFLNRLSEESGCGLLLDVTNLFVNARNHGFDPLSWLHDIDPDRVVQLHVVGYTQQRERWHDLHEEPIQDDLWRLIAAVLDHATPQGVIIERDGNFPPIDELEADLRRLAAMTRAPDDAGYAAAG